MTVAKTYYIVGALDHSVDSLFSRIYGMDRTSDMDACDLMIFTGGEDIDPALYNEKPLKNTHFNEARDELEIEAYWIGYSKNKQMIGICRGAQLIHVMHGYTLWQHVSGHAIGGREHDTFDIPSGAYVRTTSCHHQMMRVDPKEDKPKYKVIGIAAETTQRHSVEKTERTSSSTRVFRNDIEVLWYPEDRHLCYQGHPEYRKAECLLYFTALMKRYEFIDKTLSLTVQPKSKLITA